MVVGFGSRPQTGFTRPNPARQTKLDRRTVKRYFHLHAKAVSAPSKA